MLYHSWISAILYLLVFISADSNITPRGVSLDRSSLYLPAKDFTCFDKTLTVPFSYVNDDYCDCLDGSDEPGTSACLNGVFFCANNGYRPLNLTSSRVNDGVCDCCDGSDEYSSDAVCNNTCDHLGLEARAEAQRLIALHNSGSQIRQGLIVKSNRKLFELKEQLVVLEKEMLEAEKVKAAKELLKIEIENKENEALKIYKDTEEHEKENNSENYALRNEGIELFKKIDLNHDGVLSLEEVRLVDAFDKNKDGQLDDEELRYFDLESGRVDLEAYLSTTWLFLKPVMMMEQAKLLPASEEQDSENVEDDEESTDNEKEENKPRSGEEVSVYDEKTQILINEAIEARQQFFEADRTLREIENKLNSIKKDLVKDYGIQNEFAALDGECVEYEDKEYIYKLCLFQKVIQKSKNDDYEITLGEWGHWGVSQNYTDYSLQKYLNGFTCWNGPQRMTTVNIRCGLETKLTSVSEPHICEYVMELSTPAVCDAQYIQELIFHDEL